ncbi:MAG: ArgR family transcriptional regulator [Peptococcaceae bacterium BICA1-7]|nr:MAG: ArgR family transcriptional regulator [Peptococcaceae bacterium BICA1-7]HBV96856.1 arginine repressor [Desulfotomaculum sp.]
MKSVRQKRIIDIIRNMSIETQEQLANELGLAGFTITQATVSRDVKELGLIKVPGENNSSIYAVPDRTIIPDKEKRLKRLFVDSVQKIDHSENMVVLKTLPGEAQGVASAIDNSDWPEIIGTVAGDDTIIMVVKPISAVPDVVKRLKVLSGG